MLVLFNLIFGEDLKDLDEKQLVLYAQMANLVHLILQWPEINLKEIAENFSKVPNFYFMLYISNLSLLTTIT